MVDPPSEGTLFDENIEYYEGSDPFAADPFEDKPNDESEEVVVVAAAKSKSKETTIQAPKKAKPTRPTRASIAAERKNVSGQKALIANATESRSNLNLTSAKLGKRKASTAGDIDTEPEDNVYTASSFFVNRK